MKISTKLSVILVGLLMLLAALSPASSLPNLTSPRMIVESNNGSSYYSTNWSGYAVTGSTGSVTYASGSWTVPTVTGHSTAYAACWVGIDGFSSDTVEQTGTLSQISGGTPTYYAWYEFYPQESIVQINTVPVSPNDKISASVTYSTTPSNEFTLNILDTTTGKSFSITETVASLKYTPARSSAEWIVEAPSSNSGVLPLANFGTAFFGPQYTTISGTCYATVGGTGPAAIGSFSSSVQTITMVNNRGTILAQPTSLTPTSGTSFTVTEPSPSPTPTPTPSPTPTPRPTPSPTPTPPPHHHGF